MKSILLKGSRKIYRSLFHPNFPRWGWPKEGERESTNKLLYNLISSEKPCFIGRVGTVEGAIVLNKMTLTKPWSLQRLKGCINYIIDETRMPWWDCGLPFQQLHNNAGFFTKSGNISVRDAERFAEIYLHYIPIMDVLGRFSYNNKFFPFSPKCKHVQLESLYPFFVEEPWTKALEGKNVLVVHPFKKTIEEQYKRRQLLFKNPNCLPQFNLKVIKAIQSAAGEVPPYKDWFEALDYMKNEIAKTDFDVALIGCGAYGLPLAGFIKEELYKQAVHIGGGTQLLFGIKGQRWIRDYEQSCYRDMFNEYWVFPNEEERPQNAKIVEGACYW